MTPAPAAFDILCLEECTKATTSRDESTTERSARLLINARPVPGSRLDAFLFLAGRESLWRTADPGADLPEAVRRYEAAAGRRLARATSLPSFGAVERGVGECRREVAVRLAGRFLGRLSSPSRGGRYAEDWEAHERLLVTLGASCETARMEPHRALLDFELRVIDLARVHLVEPGVCV